MQEPSHQHDDDDRALHSTMESSSNDHDVLSFMTFGDGDFSYSLDMAKYLLSAKELPARSCHIVATGIDSLEEVNAKYRDTPFILKQLHSLNQSSDSVSVDVRHGVNAIQPPPSKEANHDEWKSHHVIFNHPHIGTEDAALHSRFLSHFLHAASEFWMKDDGGLLHLTLVKGQYERWKCEEAAKRLDLVLLERNTFVAPPYGGHYQYRRHQTGKSFASRAIGGSETFTFGRKKDRGKYVSTCLPWQRHDSAATTVDYPCPHCGKSFREERSRKSHVKTVHHSDDDRKRKRVEALQCQKCKAMNRNRLFPHQQALDDHVKAKHYSLHPTVKPDWARDKDSLSQKVEESSLVLHDRDVILEQEVHTDVVAKLSHGSCSICGHAYQSEADKAQHLKEFVPVPITESGLHESSADKYKCSFCGKGFREQRARRQHENRCVDRAKTNQAYSLVS